MTAKRSILITNDDGILSPGIRAAVEAVIDLGSVTVVAPQTQQTGAGRSVSASPGAALIPMDFPVPGESTVRAYGCQSTPAMAVRHGMRVLFDTIKPDLVISGINYGENLGTSISASGTVGAALEGASYGVPAIAISKQTDVHSHRAFTDQDWGISQQVLRQFSIALLQGSLPSDVDVLKIDIPDSVSNDLNWKLTKLARQSYYVSSLDSPSLESKVTDAKTSIVANLANLQPDTDIHTFAGQGVISVTPLSLDLTSRVPFDDLYKQLKITDI